MSFRLSVLSLFLMLVSTACGGGGGGSTPTPPPPPPGDQPPTLNVIAPSGPEAEIPGGQIRVAFIANDDGNAAVRAFLDTDGDPATLGDQTLLFTRGHQNGAPQMVRADIPASMALGTTTLFLEINDAVNPVVRSAGTSLLLYGGIAGVAPNRSNAYGVTGDVIVFSVGEAEDGGTVLNNDGLADDGVMAYVDTGTLTVTQTVSSADVTAFGTAGLPGSSARSNRRSPGTCSRPTRGWISTGTSTCSTRPSC